MWWGGGGGGGLLSVRWPIVAQCSCQSEICGCKNESAKCTVFINIHGSSSSFAFMSTGTALLLSQLH